MLLGTNRINLLPRDGEMCLFHDPIAVTTAEAHFTDLYAAVSWQQETARIMGRLIPVPRLSAWYGEGSYRFSGIQHLPVPMPDCLLPLQVVAEEVARCRFNSVLVNLYRDGRDSVSWHSDDEAGLGRSSPASRSVLHAGSSCAISRIRACGCHWI
jgi:alkylated DNA repair dioxygenase AlkB